MTISYASVFNIQYDSNLSQSQITQAAAALLEIENTVEGQALFSLIQSQEGQVNLDFNQNGFSGASETPFSIDLVTISFSELSQLGYHGADGELHHFSLQRALVHELFHVVEDVYFADDSLTEGLAMQFANEYMAKYYGEDRRSVYTVDALVQHDLPNNPEVFNANFNANGHASYQFIGKPGEDISALLNHIGADEFANNSDFYLYKLVAAEHGFSVASDAITTDYYYMNGDDSVPVLADPDDDGVLGRFRNVDDLYSDPNDSLTTANTKVLYAFSGNDTIDVIGGGRIVYAGLDDDTLIDNGGDNTLDGGEGADTFKFTGIYNNDEVSNTGDTDLTDDVIEIDGQVLEGFAAENASGSGWTLGEYALNYDNNLLKIAGSNGTITLSDWANDGEYGIQLEGSAGGEDASGDADGSGGANVSGSMNGVAAAVAGSAEDNVTTGWFKVDRWFSVEGASINEYNGTINPNKPLGSVNTFPETSVFSAADWHYIQNNRSGTQWSASGNTRPRADHSDDFAPTLGEYHSGVHGYFLSGHYTNDQETSYRATSAKLIYLHERVSEIVVGPGLYDTPDGTSNFRGPLTIPYYEAINYTGGFTKANFYEYQWFHGRVDLSNGASSVGVYGSYTQAEETGGTLVGTKGNDTMVSGTGDDYFIGGGGNDQIQFNGNFGNDSVIGGEQIVVDGVTLDGSQSSFTYSYGSLLIEDDNGNSIYLADWEEDGDYGITLGQEINGTLTGNIVSERITQVDVGTYELMDWDGDGQVDIVSTGGAYGAVITILDGATGAATGLGTQFSNYRFADMNGDGQMDIVSTHQGGVGWYDGANLGQFTRISWHNPGSNYEVGDFNNDGMPDIVASLPTFASGAAFTGSAWLDGAVTDAALNRITYNSLGNFQLFDLDNDGLLDIIASGSTYGSGDHVGGTVTYEYNAASVSTMVRHSYIEDPDFQIAQMDGDDQWEVITNEGIWTSGISAGGVLILEGENTTMTRLIFNNAGDYVPWDSNGDGISDVLIGTQGVYAGNNNPPPITGVVAHDISGSFTRFGDQPWTNVDDLSLGDWDGDGTQDVIAQNGSAYGTGLIYYVHEGANDTLVGTVGNDTISGGRGNDKLSGNSGADTFQFSRGMGVDIVTDFELGVDTLFFSGVLGITSAQEALDATSYANGNATIATLEGSITLTGIGSGLGLDDIVVA